MTASVLAVALVLAAVAALLYAAGVPDALEAVNAALDGTR